MGMFKNEAVAKDSPFRSGALKTETDVMEIVFEWVHWWITVRGVPTGGTNVQNPPRSETYRGSGRVLCVC